MKKTKKGITLIALVITIVVLLILAGVTINMLLGDNGILRNAEVASEKYKNKEDQEQQDLAKIENEIENYVGSTRNNETRIVLWENPNDSTKPFNAQRITFSTDQYDYFEVLYRYSNTEPDFMVMKMYKGYTFSLNAGSGYSNKYAKRNITFVDNRTFDVENGYWGSSTPNNDVCIPVKIIGYKY